jgi:hypothetical protein
VSGACKVIRRSGANRYRVPRIPLCLSKNLMLTMFRRAWENFCRSKGQYEHLFAAQTAFHIGEAQAPLGKRIPWGQKDKRCSSMLQNSAGGRVCQYGVSATPAFWPYLHFKLKARVLVRRTLFRQGRCRHRRHRNTASFTADDLQGLAQQAMVRSSSYCAFPWTCSAHPLSRRCHHRRAGHGRSHAYCRSS